MSDTKELKKIKKKYGEKFKNLCRELFPIIIEEKGALLSILEKNFSNNCNSLYEAITENGLEIDFKEYIFSEFDLKKEKVLVEETRTPYEILEEAGYDLIECKTEEEIQSFKKYYSMEEVLCTIYNKGRLQTRYCFFAVKKDVSKIHRGDFKKPNRDDEYSTSVLAIQFTRDRASTVHIISRYNHKVENPDATFGGDLDRLAPGLYQSFGNLLKERGLTLTTEKKEGFRIPGYTLASDGKYYKYNMEINGDYYCPGNIIISNGEARSIGEPEKGLLIDNYYLDFQNKTIKSMINFSKGAFEDTFENAEKIEVKRVRENDVNKVIKVYTKDVKEPMIIEIDKDNKIVGYKNHNITSIGDNFLWLNTTLTKLELPNLREVGSNFLNKNKMLKRLELPNLRKVKNSFLLDNDMLLELQLPNLEEVAQFFLRNNNSLKRLELPKLRKIGDGFLSKNKVMEEVGLLNLEEVGDSFFSYNEKIRELELPNLQKAGAKFFHLNKSFRKLEVPKFSQIEKRFQKIIEENIAKDRRQLINKIKVKREVIKEQEDEIEKLQQEKTLKSSKKSPIH